AGRFMSVTRRFACLDALGTFGPLGAATSLARDELIRLDVDQQQLARQRTVPEGVLFVAANAHALAQLGGAGEDRRVPVQTRLAQALAEILIEIQQARLVAQAFV